MTRTTRQTKSKPPFVVAFAGNGDVEQKNVDALLDNFFPEGDHVKAVIPDTVRRSQKGLMNAWNWCTEFDIPVEKLDPADFISYLTDAGEDAEVFLVLAWKDGDKVAEQLLDQAIAAEVPVKDLCKALDDLEFDEVDQAVPEEEQQDPEPPAATKTRGKPRGTTQAKDTNVPTEAPVLDAGVTTFGDALEAVIRAIVRDELNPEKATISAQVNEDGQYKLTGKGRPGKGWTSVKLTPTEAREAGLEVDDS